MQTTRTIVQELEIVIGDEHISFTTSKIGSVVDVNQSKHFGLVRAYSGAVYSVPYQLSLLFFAINSRNSWLVPDVGRSESKLFRRTLAGHWT